MKYALSYPEPLRTKAVHAGNQQTLITDAPADNGGLGEAYSPTDLVAVGLASCIMTILGLRAASRGLTISSMEADAEKKMSPNPRRIGRIEIGLTVKIVGRNGFGSGLASGRGTRLPCRAVFTSGPPTGGSHPF